MVKGSTLVLSPRQVAEALLRAAVADAAARGVSKRKLAAFRKVLAPGVGGACYAP